MESSALELIPPLIISLVSVCLLTFVLAFPIWLCSVGLRPLSETASKIRDLCAMKHVAPVRAKDIAIGLENKLKNP